MFHAIIYQYYTKLMIQSLISCVVTWLNLFPTKGRISKIMILSIIVKGKPNPYSNQERYVFVSCDLVCTGPSKDIKIRSIPSIEKNE